MVCFTSSTYRFQGKDARNWFKALKKYLDGVPVTVEVYEGKNEMKKQEVFKGEIDDTWANDARPEQMLSSLINSTDNELSSSMENKVSSPTENKVSSSTVNIENYSFIIQTERFWSEYCAIKSLPDFPHKTLNDIAPFSEDEEYWKLIEPTIDLTTQLPSVVINLVIPYLRISKQVGEVAKRIQSVVGSWSKNLDMAKTSNFANEVTWENIVCAIHNLENVERIRKYIILETCKVVILVLNAGGSVLICRRGIISFMMPVLDLDDGFISEFSPAPREFNKYFKIWREKFDNSNGATWDEPIFPCVQISCDELLDTNRKDVVEEKDEDDGDTSPENKDAGNNTQGDKNVRDPRDVKDNIVENKDVKDIKESKSMDDKNKCSGDVDKCKNDVDKIVDCVDNMMSNSSRSTSLQVKNIIFGKLVKKIKALIGLGSRG